MIVLYRIVPRMVRTVLVNVIIMVSVFALIPKLVKKLVEQERIQNANRVFAKVLYGKVMCRENGADRFYSGSKKCPNEPPLTDIHGVNIYCGSGSNHQDCPDGYECNKHPGGLYAVCCKHEGYTASHNNDDNIFL